MGLHKTVYLPAQPGSASKTYYALIRNSTQITEPLRSNIGGDSAGGVFLNTTNQFSAISGFDCATPATWDNAAWVFTAENTGACGNAFYRLELHDNLYAPGLHLDLHIYEQIGGSPDYSSDLFVTTASHYTGDVEFGRCLQVVPSDDTDTSRLVARFCQDSRLKDSDSTPSFAVSHGALTGSVIKQQEGVYYQTLDLTGVTESSYVHASVTADMKAGYFDSGWVDPGPVCRTIDQSQFFRKGSDLSTSISDLQNTPVITGS